MADTLDGWRAELLDGTIVPIKITPPSLPLYIAMFRQTPYRLELALPLSDGRKEVLTLDVNAPWELFALLAKALHGRAVLLSPGMESRKELVDRTRREALTQAAGACDRVSSERRHRDEEPTCICYAIGRGSCSDCDDATACESAIYALRDEPVTERAKSILSDAKIKAMLGVCNGELRVWTAAANVTRARELLGREIDGVTVQVNEERLDRVRGR